MKIEPSKTLEFHAKIREFVRNGKEIISLGLGEAECGTPQHIIDAGIDALKQGKTKYSAAAGIGMLREKIAEKLSKDNAIDAKNHEIVVTPGAKNALYLSCLSLLNDGDEAVLIRPCYVSNYSIVTLANSRVKINEVNLKEHDFQLDFQELRRAVNEKTKLLFINTPHNPTGRVMRQHELQSLFGLMQKYPNLHILSDEVYERLVTGPYPHISPASDAGIAERVITVNGFSKAYFMTGWRVGYLHSKSKQILSNAVKTQQHINTNTAVFTQMAALAALEGRDVYRDYLERLRQRKLIYEAFLRATPHLSGSAYEGGYFSFVNTRKTNLDGDAFATRLLEKTGVAVVPGASFGSEYPNFFRLSFVNSTDLFRKGLERIHDFAEEL